jgi:hypothetical protein
MHFKRFVSPYRRFGAVQGMLCGLSAEAEQVIVEMRLKTGIFCHNTVVIEEQPGDNAAARW